VRFIAYGGRIGWVPLAPSEVRYPAHIDAGFRRGVWSWYFSVGACAVYTAGTRSYCEPQAWTNVAANSVTPVSNVGRTSRSASVNRPRNALHWIPVNSRIAYAVTTATPEEFRGHSWYRTLDFADGSAMFARGHAVDAAAPGFVLTAGPVTIRPTAQSMTPTHLFTHVSSAAIRAVVDRPTYRAPASSALVSGSNSSRFDRGDVRQRLPSFSVRYPDGDRSGPSLMAAYVHGQEERRTSTPATAPPPTTVAAPRTTYVPPARPEAGGAEPRAVRR
jgi:hypothetical protein